MTRHHRKNESDPPVATPEAPPPAVSAPGSPGSSSPEQTGLTGVDVECLPPATREELESLRRERDELKEQLLRRRAEFENFRKRMERERDNARTDAIATVLKALGPVLDNLDRALGAEGSDASLREGVELTRRELLAILESQGVKLEDPQGQPFDPERHQALAHEPVPGVPEGTVVEVYRKGYSYRDRLLRPALVKVAAASGAHKVH
jgi:molecular chaperone GrpE